MDARQQPNGDSFRLRRLARILPKEQRDPTGARLARLVDDIAQRKVPVNSFARVWTLGSLQAQISMGYFAYWLRSRFVAQEEKERLKSEAHLAAALKLFGTMGYLRGAVMKVGQMLANLPEVLPEQFAEVLSALHFEAPPMHFSMVREVFLDEFRREPEELFASFDRRAFAAASLGQVHRARLKSGEEVAVKIQYPGIARTIRNDLRNLRLLLQPLSLGGDWEDTVVKLADIEQMLLTETDYEQEARYSEAARRLFPPEDGIAVPRVFPELSTRRVLTTEYLEGCHLEEFLERNPSQEERDRYTSLLTVATMRLYYRLHWLLADPHPGNIIFMSDGRMGMIDFGCTRVLNEHDWQLSCDCIDGALQGDREREDRAIARSCRFGSVQEMEPGRLEVMRRSLMWTVEPWLREGLFDFGDRDFFRRGIDIIVEATRKGYTRSLPMSLWSNRFTIGGRAFCYRLRGRAPFREIYEEEWKHRGE